MYREKQLRFTDEAKDKSIKYKNKFYGALEQLKECRSAQKELNNWIDSHKEKITDIQLNQLKVIINNIDNNTVPQIEESLEVINNCPHYTATCVRKFYFTAEDLVKRAGPIPFYNYICDACGKEIKMEDYETLAKEKGYLKDEEQFDIRN